MSPRTGVNWETACPMNRCNAKASHCPDPLDSPQPTPQPKRPQTARFPRPASPVFYWPARFLLFALICPPLCYSLLQRLNMFGPRQTPWLASAALLATVTTAQSSNASDVETLFTNRIPFIVQTYPVADPLDTLTGW